MTRKCSSNRSETPENEGPGSQKRTKTPILCSKRLKSGAPKPQSAQKPRFCARKALKRGSRQPKAHKNPDFVLETPENGGSKASKRTKTSILCSKCPKTGLPDPKSAQKCRFCGREDWDRHRREVIGIGKRNRCLPANHRARFENVNTT